MTDPKKPMPARIWADRSDDDLPAYKDTPFGIWWHDQRDGYTEYAHSDEVEALTAERDAAATEVTVGEWQPIETAPVDEGVLHLRGVWVFSVRHDGSKFASYFDCAAGRLGDDGDFVTPSGDDTGWHAEDYDWWAPIPDDVPPRPEPRAPATPETDR